MSRSRKPQRKADIVTYLSNHERYNTMNSWNRCTSFSRCVKIVRVCPRDVMNTAFDVLDVYEWGVDTGFKHPLDEWQLSHDNQYQWGMNGRSSGYVVMYEGGYLASDKCYKRYCTVCGQGNYRQESNQCGRCHAEPLIDYPFKQIVSYPGRGVGSNEDWEEMMLGELRIWRDLVWSFDLAVDQAIANFVEYCRTHRVVDEEVLVSKTIRVAEEING